MRVLHVVVAAFAAYALTEASAGPRLRGTENHIRQAWPAPHADDGYFSGYLSGPGGQRTPLRAYPGSASVVTRRMMNDLQANTICDALRFAPGVVAGGC